MRKLRAMSAEEVIGRLSYSGYTAYERAAHRLGLLATANRLQRALASPLSRPGDGPREAVARMRRPRFFPGVEQVDGVRAAFESRYGKERTEARDVADEVLSGRVEFFGRTFSFGSEIDWHADPVTGAPWPRVYHLDVPVHGGDVGFGDVKYVWELNRHQFFVDLAKIAFLDQSRAHAEALHRLLRQWMADAPYATGAPWACALEPAFRTWSWLWAYHLVRAAGMLDAEMAALWLTGFYDHGRFLYRHLERYSSPYNHLVGEASALFAIGLLFPELRAADAWAARGREVLESTLSRQFHADGGSVEQSAFYHHATLGFYLLAAVLGRLNGVELSPGVWSAIERGVQFSAALSQPNGRVPRIGGADDGKPLRLEHLPFWDFRPYQAIGAVLFSRSDFRFIAGRFWEDALWVLGPDGAAAFDRLEPRTPATTAALPASGYYVVRSDWTAEADYLCFDCGPQAAGLRRDGVPSAAHGHADCLSVVVALGGREVLVDPGFFCYNGDPQWEVYFRRTAAHNTIVIDGRDQATHLSKMAWMRTYTARPEGWSPDSLGWARGSHDGYNREPGGVTHRRTAWLRPGGYVVIHDEVTGAGVHDAEAVFQFAPGHLALGDSSALHDDRYEVAWICSAPLRTSVSCGGSSPSSGWIASSLGVGQPAPRLTLAFQVTGGRAVLLTIVADRSRHRPAIGRRVATGARVGDRVLRAHVAGSGVVDEILAAVDGAAATDEVDTDAPLAVVQRTHGVITEAVQAGGTYIRTTLPARAMQPELADLTVL